MNRPSNKFKKMTQILIEMQTSLKNLKITTKEPKLQQITSMNEKSFKIEMNLTSSQFKKQPYGSYGPNQLSSDILKESSYNSNSSAIPNENSNTETINLWDLFEVLNTENQPQQNSSKLAIGMKI